MIRKKQNRHPEQGCHNCGKVIDFSVHGSSWNACGSGCLSEIQNLPPFEADSSWTEFCAGEDYGGYRRYFVRCQEQKIPCESGDVPADVVRKHLSEKVK